MTLTAIGRMFICYLNKVALDVNMILHLDCTGCIIGPDALLCFWAEQDYNVCQKLSLTQHSQSHLFTPCREVWLSLARTLAFLFKPQSDIELFLLRGVLFTSTQPPVCPTFPLYVTCESDILSNEYLRWFRLNSQKKFRFLWKNWTKGGYDIASKEAKISDCENQHMWQCLTV